MEETSARDQFLVDSVLRGDTENYAELVSKHQKLVASVAWRYGVPQEEIEDVVSEVFIKTYNNLHRYQAKHPFSTWFYRLAANHVIDHERRKRKERGRVEFPLQLADHSHNSSQLIEIDERATLLRAALDSLADHYRAVLFLVYVEEMKISEAARILKLPQGTIKTRLMRGREALRKVLIQRHPEYFGEQDAL
jgi:RNA polymerase sigma-70 factor (ECF subfamily)